MLNKTKYRRDIQVLRGLAVVAVVLFHANESLFPLGYLGVDVFFVISGFVVTPLMLRAFEKHSGEQRVFLNLGQFYKRRLYRLAPALGVTLSISAVAIFLFGTPGDHARFSHQGLATIFLLGNFGAYRYSGDYFSANPNPLIHTWSLSVEEQIYIVLPIILLVFLHNRNRIKNFVLILWTAITTISLTSFLFPSILEPFYSRAGIQIPSQISFYSPVDRIWQFTLGGIAYLILRRDKSSIRFFSKKIDYLLVIPLIIVLFGSFNSGLKLSSLIVSILSVAIVLFRSLEVIPSFMTSIFEWFGDRSYSIYLVHMPILYLAKYSPIISSDKSQNKIIWGLIAIGASVALGSLSYTQIENRFRINEKNISYGLPNTTALGIFTLVVPFVLFMVMAVGISHQYWGLDRNEKQPPYAGFLDANCERDTLNGGPCIYDYPNASKTVILIGDSHAGMLSEAFVKSSIKNELRAIVWTHSGCRFQLIPSSNLYDYCLPINRKIYRYIAKLKPDAILISQSISVNYDLRPLKEAIVKLKSYSGNVAIVGDTPVFPDSDRFMRPMPIVISPYKAPQKFDFSSMDLGPFQISKKMETWSKTNNVGFLSINSIFCDRLSCNRWSSGGWLYRDSDHLSVLGANLTIPTLSTWMLKIS
jgi:peptidoglycan/LPS O-acetylase OafA/YrhL